MKFWKLLADTKFTGRPSQLAENEVWRIVKAAGLIEPEIEAVFRGLREFKNQKD